MGYLPLRIAVAIDNGVPLPAKRGGGRQARLFPWLEMKVGDSFFAPRPQAGMARNAHSAGQRYALKYATRAVTENGVKGTRVWRVA